jgi:hypothetical protein
MEVVIKKRSEIVIKKVHKKRFIVPQLLSLFTNMDMKKQINMCLFMSMQRILI